MRKTVYVLVACLLAACVVVGSGGRKPATAGKQDRPNVLIIVTDDQRGGLEVMSALRDKFIRGGRKYPNFFATTPQCCPSRMNILTGRYTHNHGVENNDSSQGLDPRTMLQYYLQRAGYRTALYGKFLNSWGPRLSPPFFNKWGTFDPPPKNPYDDTSYNLNGDTTFIPGYTTNVLGRLSAKFIRQSEENDDRRPWMLYVAPTAPHAPYIPADRYRGKRVGDWDGNPAVFETDRRDKPEYVRNKFGTFKSGTRRRQRQLRTLMSVDDVIQKLYRVMRKLDERDTIAFFVSDNGLLWAEHGLLTKNIPYEQSVNVPFAARWPGHIRRSSVDDRLVGNIDITPTVLDAANINPSDTDFDGKSLLNPSWERDRILLEFFGPALSGAIPPWASTRTDTYKYTEYYNESGEVTFREYYDLVSDPWELENTYEDDDLLNDPTPAETEFWHQQLMLDRSCAEETCP